MINVNAKIVEIKENLENARFVTAQLLASKKLHDLKTTECINELFDLEVKLIQLLRKL